MLSVRIGKRGEVLKREEKKKKMCLGQRTRGVCVCVCVCVRAFMRVHIWQGKKMTAKQVNSKADRWERCEKSASAISVIVCACLPKLGVADQFYVCTRVCVCHKCHSVSGASRDAMWLVGGKRSHLCLERSLSLLLCPKSRISCCRQVTPQ